MKVVIVVQARMTSTRLPGKVLKEVLGKSLLEYLIERLRRVRLTDEFVIATTINETDDAIVSLCRRLAVPVMRGSELNVLSRYYEAATAQHADVVVRITSDCPAIDPQVIDTVIAFFLDNRDKYDYVSNTLKPSFPYGMAVEVFSYASLADAYREATNGPELEHVTPFIYLRPDRYRIGHFIHSEDLSRHRWTVDTPEDFELIRRLIEENYPINPEFGMREVLDTLQTHPDWVSLNAHIAQKKLGD
ncbi:MAG TPA: glycosyltransferase family protein [Noviherbaspirillum sp.]|nr:glycosyltransferase family protein [Noviherbaspirillum sp.]